MKKKYQFGIPTRSDTNPAVAGTGKGLYYPCMENKDADQLRDYRKDELRLCVHISANCWFCHAKAHYITDC